MITREAFVKSEGCTFPGQSYVEALLKPVFNDQRDYLFEAMFALHRAHVIMLAEQHLLHGDDAKTILEGLNDLSRIDRTKLHYQPQYEDLFFTIESMLADLIGEDLAGNVHMARSRNDMGEGMYRYVLRERILSLVKDVDLLSEALLEQAGDHIESVMTAHTHTQPAQPTTFGHYLLAIFDNVQRDRKRLLQAYDTVNQSPLGAAAITTTGFNISRERLAELLGFDGVLENAYDAIGTGDYLLETAQAIISLMVNMGRWIQEFLRFATHEVGLIRVADPYVQISSIMPQKRNPVSIEHSRALASRSVGNANTVIQMLHNTPYGDIVDTEDDLQPMLYKSFSDASRAMKLMHSVIRTMSFNKDHAVREARKNLIVITEFADVLTRDHGISFRKAHKIAAQIANESVTARRELYDWTVDDINQYLNGVSLTDEEWNDIIDPNVFVQRRSVLGGTNCNEVERMLANRHDVLRDQQSKLNFLEGKLENAERKREMAFK
ncbi:argininosuccinate lyase [Lentibacillus saliphilus]|uniref:argininosuccinate lyase n=1 Tax=Lentibacillus saliphilus TaxID=2737028 RepID=UPI001C30C79C|nr:argininosuccinate lyase [Lentibacillus saliphilus]